MDLQLNEDQRFGLDKMIKFTTDPKYPFKYLLLQGPAGVGKTVVIAAYVRLLQELDTGTVIPEFRIGLSAPTHKAVKQMRKHRMEGVSYATVHSALAMKLERNMSTGKEKYVPDKYNKEKMVDGINVWIIDESSMLHDELVESIVKLKRWRTDLKIIFVGDAAQVPPVGLVNSKPFIAEFQVLHRIEVVNLNKIERQGEGSPIITYATYIRECIRDLVPVVSPIAIPGVLDVIAGNPEWVKQWIRDHFKSQEFSKDTDYAKIIAWQNSTVNAVNTIIRRELYDFIPKEERLPKLMIGERLVMNSTLVNEYGKALLNNSEELLVISYEEKVLPVTFDYLRNGELDEKTIKVKYYDTQVEYDSMLAFGMLKMNIKIIHESEEKRWQQLLEGLQAQASSNFGWRSLLYKSYWKLKDMFADVNYNYAITTHKSQGSTYHSSLVMFWDINMQLKYDRKRDSMHTLSEVNRIKYTAVTRPSRHLVIVP